jgi:hypothetical protein
MQRPGRICMQFLNNISGADGACFTRRPFPCWYSALVIFRDPTHILLLRKLRNYTPVSAGRSV